MNLYYLEYEAAFYADFGETHRRYACLWFPSLREAKRFLGVQLRASMYTSPRSRKVIEVREIRHG